MKATTILTRLQRAADRKQVSRNSWVFKTLRDLATTPGAVPVLRPVWYDKAGRGRYNVIDHRADLTGVLNLLRVKFTTGNDAPRGGAAGAWVKIMNFKH